MKNLLWYDKLFGTYFENVNDPDKCTLTYPTSIGTFDIYTNHATQFMKRL